MLKEATLQYYARSSRQPRTCRDGYKPSAGYNFGRGLVGGLFSKLERIGAHNA